MPPPPADYQTKTKAASLKKNLQVSSRNPDADVRHENLSPKAAGKRKAQEVIEILDDDDDDDGYTTNDLVTLGSRWSVPCEAAFC